MDPSVEIFLVSAEGKEFLINRNLLISQSDFFKAMFNSGMKECREEKIHLPTVSAESLKLMLDIIQKQQAIDSTELVSNVIDVAIYLQMPELTETCSQKLIDSLSLENWAQTGKMADDYILCKVTRAVQDFMHSNFHLISGDKDFNTLPLDVVTELLSGELHVSTEYDVFKAALQWLTTNNRLDDPDAVACVFDCVRFPLMQFEQDLEQCDNDLRTARVNDKCAVFSDIVTAKDCLRNPRIILEKDLGIKVIVRRSALCLLTLGGFTKSDATTNRIMLTLMQNLQDSDSDSLHWRLHPRSKRCPVLPQALCEQSVVAVGVFVFVAGGQSQYCLDGRHTKKNVYCLDTRTFVWSKVSPMAIPRSLFYLGALGSYVYAVGGWVKPNMVSRSVERYDIVADKWERVTQLEIGLHEHAGASHKGLLYITGGYKGPHQGHLDRVWAYHPETAVWQELASMLQARSYHCMVSTGDYLVVAGGVNYIGNDAFEDVKSCEQYTVATDQWSVISQVPRCASCMSYCIYERSIYIFGGHSFETESDHKYIQIFNISTKEWTEKLMTNNNINFFTSVIAHVSSGVVVAFR